MKRLLMGGAVLGTMLVAGSVQAATINVPADQPTIQAAVAAASSGDTINIAAGTYTEAGQILIDKNLSIVGADKATTVIKPGQDTSNAGDSRGWFLVPLGITFNLSKVTLDGSGHLIYMGLYYWGNGTVNDVNITNIKYNESGPDYQGRGMIIKGNVNVSNSTFTQVGRIGVQYFGGSGTVDSNTFTGKGTGNWLDYGVELGNGAIVTISNNTISGNQGVASDNSTSAGILVTTFFGPGTTATITGNTVTGNTEGIAVGQDSSDTSTVSAHNNSIAGNDLGIATKVAPVDATNNWWGNASGPTIASNPTGTGAVIDDAVSYSPWYVDADKTTLSDAAALPDVDGNVTVTDTNKDVIVTSVSQPVTIEAGDTVDATIDLGALISSGTGYVPQITVNSDVATIEIPATTITSSDTSWDGTVHLPQIVTTTVQPTTNPGFSASAVNSIEVGFGDTHLTFDDAVKLTFPGLASSSIGWSQNGAFHEINAVCDSATTPTLAADSECKINVDSDLIVWTKHFTTFTTYSQAPLSASSVVRSSSRSGDSNRVSQAVVSVAGAGEVLGASDVFDSGKEAQIASIKVALKGLISQLIALLQQQLVLAQASQN